MSAEKKSKNEWELHYHTGIGGPGRGEFVRLLFEATGTEYTFCGIDGEVRKAFFEGRIEGFPCLAPPMIKHNGLQLSQTPIVCKYIGKKLGLYPESESDEWHAEQLNNTIHDYIAEGRLAFHGKDFFASYFVQVEETKPYIECFLSTRLKKFVDHFEKALAYNKGGSGYLVGDKLTYVDLAMLHVLRATEAQFPDAWTSINYAPLLKAYKDRLSALPLLAEYFKSDRCMPFSGNSMM